MKTERHYDTVTEAVEGLKNRGFTVDFSSLTQPAIKQFFHDQIALLPEEFEIVETYRFEGNTDPGDEMIVYAIASKNGKIRGRLANGYGMYANTDVDDIISLLAKAHACGE